MRQVTALAIFESVWLRSARALIAAILCVLLAEQPLLAEAEGAKSRPAKVPAAVQLQGEQRVLHVLNRLTFGPRPGDVETVEAMGLQRWFESQLNPTAIPDTALEQRLEMFPAMKMQQADLMERYPSPQRLRQMIQQKDPLPTDPAEHAIYADQIAFYKMAQARKAAANGVAKAPDGEAMTGAMAPSSAMAPAEQKVRRGVDLLGDGQAKSQSGDEDSMTMEAGKAALPGDGVDPGIASMTTHEEQFYSGLEAVKVINLPPDQRVSRNTQYAASGVDRLSQEPEPW